jgi:predicted RNase H-like HicB family nuclease
MPKKLSTKGRRPTSRSYTVRAIWDDEAKVWVAESDDVPGLITEAASPEELAGKLRILVPELLELNGRLAKAQLISIKIRGSFQHEERVEIRAA